MCIVIQVDSVCCSIFDLWPARQTVIQMSENSITEKNVLKNLWNSVASVDMWFSLELKLYEIELDPFTEVFFFSGWDLKERLGSINTPKIYELTHKLSFFTRYKYVRLICEVIEEHAHCFIDIYWGGGTWNKCMYPSHHHILQNLSKWFLRLNQSKLQL